jgi:hypothetical protein
MCTIPPYDREEVRARLTADLRALGVARLEAEDVLVSNRPNIPLSELTGGRLEGLLSVIGQWIHEIRAHAGEAEASGESGETDSG